MSKLRAMTVVDEHNISYLLQSEIVSDMLVSDKLEIVERFN